MEFSLDDSSEGEQEKAGLGCGTMNTRFGLIYKNRRIKSIMFELR